MDVKVIDCKYIFEILSIRSYSTLHRRCEGENWRKGRKSLKIVSLEQNQSRSVEF